MWRRFNLLIYLKTCHVGGSVKKAAQKPGFNPWQQWFWLLSTVFVGGKRVRDLARVTARSCCLYRGVWDLGGGGGDLKLGPLSSLLVKSACCQVKRRDVWLSTPSPDRDHCESMCGEIMSCFLYKQTRFTNFPKAPVIFVWSARSSVVVIMLEEDYIKEIVDFSLTAVTDPNTTKPVAAPATKVLITGLKAITLQLTDRSFNTGPNTRQKLNLCY